MATPVLLLQAHAKRLQPYPHAKKTLLSLQNAIVLVAQPQLVKFALPRVITKVILNGQPARDPMSLKQKNKLVNVPTKTIVGMVKSAPKPAISKACVSVLQVMMLLAWKKSHLPKNVQRHATVTLRWVRILMYLVNAPPLEVVTGRCTQPQTTYFRVVITQTVPVQLRYQHL
jgi:hypothetical protein